MTFDNSQPVEGLQNENGTPMTRGDLVNLQRVDLFAIRNQVTAIITAYEAGEVTPPQIVEAAMAFARHLAGYTAVVSEQLVKHDQRQMYASPMPESITIPDSLPDDFA